MPTARHGQCRECEKIFCFPRPLLRDARCPYCQRPLRRVTRKTMRGERVLPLKDAGGPVPGFRKELP